MKYAFWVILLSCVPSLCKSQINAIQTSWTNEFNQWTIFAIDENEEEIEGQLRMRWAMNNDWSEWDYRIGEEFGAIKVKWKQNFNQWEIRGGGEIIDIQTIYRDDASLWRIKSTDVTLRLELNKRDIPFDWRVDDDRHGFYEIYTEWERDPNSWIIVDEMNEGISIHLKMAIIFLSIFSSTLP